jgi:hypothetical protein
MKKQMILLSIFISLFGPFVPVVAQDSIPVLSGHMGILILDEHSQHVTGGQLTLTDQYGGIYYPDHTIDSLFVFDKLDFTPQEYKLHYQHDDHAAISRVAWMQKYCTGPDALVPNPAPRCTYSYYLETEEGNFFWLGENNFIVQLQPQFIVVYLDPEADRKKVMNLIQDLGLTSEADDQILLNQTENARSRCPPLQVESMGLTEYNAMINKNFIVLKAKTDTNTCDSALYEELRGSGLFLNVGALVDAECKVPRSFGNSGHIGFKSYVTPERQNAILDRFSDQFGGIKELENQAFEIVLLSHFGQEVLWFCNSIMDYAEVEWISFEMDHAIVDD